MKDFNLASGEENEGPKTIALGSSQLKTSGS